MSLTIAPLFSSSSGNSTYISSEKTRILIDAGAPRKKLETELKRAGASPRTIQGIVITHEHSDHIKSVGVLSRMYDIPVYANEETWAQMEKKTGPVSRRNLRLISATEDFYIGDLCVQPFRTSHDAACSCGYTVECSGSKITVVTDLGYMTREILDLAAGSRIVLLESNYDPLMLRDGKYPQYLKRRIASNVGHLSNDDAAKSALELVRRKVRGILLAHLSENNNLPELALNTTAEYLRAAGAQPGRHVALAVARREGLTGVFHI